MPTVNELIAALEDLQLQEAQLLRELREAIEQEGLGSAEPAFSVNDRVRILNYIRPPFTRNGTLARSTPADRIATVTRVSFNRVEFTTDSGIQTTQ